ncbi:MAG TPA: RMD1 family protein [Fibrobacteria bacterium]|nr:RMD1 family protein [Fibrobacteria bacterium]
MAPETRLSLSIRAYQIAEEIDIKRCRAEFPGDLAATSPGELFYRRQSASPLGPQDQAVEGYLYVMDYGVVIFAGYGEAEASAIIDRLHPFCQGPLATRMGEDFHVRGGSQDLVLEYNAIHLPVIGPDVLRIVMLYVGQSAALDYYEESMNRMMDETAVFAKDLERYGRLKTSRKNVQRFIGRILAVRNRIVDNLYIMDAPDITWESEYLDRVDRGMKKTFDVAERFRSLDYQLREIKENLELYAELLQFRQSNMLEWIIIGLILVEVVQIFKWW